MENKDLVNFPRPCKGRIPNFVDSRDAAEKLASLDIFKKAEVIKVNIDKSQEPVRFMILQVWCLIEFTIVSSLGEEFQINIA